MDLEVFRALLSPAGQDLLSEVCAAYSESAAVALAGRLRRRHPADLVAAALTQAALRDRAQTKWGTDAARLYFTRDGLEQSTAAPVAAYRAARVAGALPVVGGALPVVGSAGGAVVDLCCGVGGDLLALARAGLAATGVDRDPLTVEIARANLAAAGLPADVLCADVTTIDRSAYAAVVADPARRSSRGRVFDPADYSPPWSFVEEVLGGTACVKTAPIIPHRLVPAGVEAEWVSLGREVKEVALWSGALRGDEGVRRRATVLLPDAEDAPSLTDADDPGSAPVAPPGRYLYEPDPAVIRAGLVTAVAVLVDGALLDPKIAYLTSDRLVSTPFASAYRVEEVLPYDLKVLRKALRARDVGTVTVKKRGVDVDPATLRTRLGVRGTRPGTLVVTRAGRGATVLLVQPVAATDRSDRS